MTDLEQVALEDAPFVRRPEAGRPDWMGKIPRGEPAIDPTTPEDLARDAELTGYQRTPTSRELGLPDWQRNPNKEGVDYDDCPNPECHQRDVPAAYIFGGRTERGEEHRGWQRFDCPCCATSWDTNTAQGAATRAAKGRHTDRLVQGADRGRVISIPSRLFSQRFALIDWSK